MLLQFSPSPLLLLLISLYLLLLPVVCLYTETTCLISDSFINISAKPQPPFSTLISEVGSPAEATCIKTLLPKQLLQQNIKKSFFNFLFLFAWVIDRTIALGHPL